MHNQYTPGIDERNGIVCKRVYLLLIRSFEGQVLLKDWTILDDGSNITETNNEEGDTLKEEVDVVAPFAIHEIVASD